MRKKPLLPIIKDSEILDRKSPKKTVRTVPYQHSESIQEEEEHSSLSQVNIIGHSKPTFLMTFPQQPIDCQGSEDFRAPTVLTNLVSNKSFEQIGFKQDQKRIHQIHQIEDSSNFSSSVNSMKSIIDRKQSTQVNQEKVKTIVNQIKLKLLNLIHYSKYNDPILTQEYKELSPLKYHYFTMYIFLSTSLSSTLSTIFIPIVQFFEIHSFILVISQISFVLALITTCQDLFFQRGPYKMIRGNIKVNYKDESKKYLDSTKLVLLIFNNFWEINKPFKLVTILLMILLQFCRQLENFENIYKSTKYFVTICQLWITIGISFACIYQVSHAEDEPSLSFCLTYIISLLTHSSNIYLEVTNQNSLIISIFMIVCYLSFAYTSMVMYIWIKPDIEIEEEKQKLLKGFVERFREKCENDGLLRRCYSYLEFRIDEDLNKTKDQLTKKLSPELEDEIDLSLRSTMIDKIELMNRFSNPFKQQLLYEIEQVTFNPEDNIIIEHQVEDLGLFYILKGQVKVQFSGSSLGTNKRSVTTLTEGQTFGQYSFITGIPSNISIFSSGVTTLMKIKRSDFTSIISNYPKDNEIFCTMKDNAFYNSKIFECYYCKIKGHYIIECRHIQYFPQRMSVIEKYLYSEKQQRRKYTRKEIKYFAWQDMSLNQDRARMYVNKQSQEQISDEFPETSQLPYSESNPLYEKVDQTHQSVSFVSNSLGQKNYSPEQPQSASNVNVESLDQFNIEQDQQYEEQQTIPFQDPQIKSIRKNSNKTTLKTAGFPINFDSNNLNNIVNNLSVIEKDDREILNQLQEAQLTKDKSILLPTRNSSSNKLTFQYQKEQSSGIMFKEDQVKTDSYQQQQNQTQTQQQGSIVGLKQSLRQGSNRSYTYSNSLSKDISNNPSSNSRNNRSQKISNLSSRVLDPVGPKKINSSKSLTEQHKLNHNKSLKSGTKNSTPNQLSQFQAITSPENQGFFINDVLFNKFEKMQEYKLYYPHNNYNAVIGRYSKYLDALKLNNFKRKRHTHTPYSIKCFVASKIRRVRKLLQKTDL